MSLPNCIKRSFNEQRHFEQPLKDRHVGNTKLKITGSPASYNTLRLQSHSALLWEIHGVPTTVMTTEPSTPAGQ
jgi:hypothetical protein